MNQSQPYMDTHPGPHMSAPQPYGSYPATASSMPQYSHYQQPSAIPQGSAHYAPGPQYGNYGYANGVTSPQSTNHHAPGPQVPSQAITLPAMHMPAPGNQHSYVAAAAPPSAGYQHQPQHTMDASGQTGPPGIKPKVTATLWEDEGSLCFQVEAKGVCVARREDNHFINGTKLLNVAGMTRGRRDGILKSEKTRHVVKIGPMHLKGVWIPFERALDFANKEKITDQLYPLFVHNIGSLLYNPDSINRTNAVVAASERRRMDSTDPGRSGNPSQAPLHHHNSMQGTVGSQPAPHSIAPHPNAGRPVLDRAHTFPTPPTSASSVMGMGNQGSTYEWGGQNGINHVSSSQPLQIDTGLGNTRSMPTTPATTPPGGAVQSMQPYSSQQSFEQKPYYPNTSASQNGYPTHPSMNRYDGSFKSEMGPPSAPGAPTTDGDQHDSKADVYGQVNGANAGADSSHPDSGYVDSNSNPYGPNRSYSYNPAAAHQHVSPEMNASPSHQTPSGRGTPRSVPGSQQQWPHDFQTPPRSAPTSSVYSVMGESRSSNGGSDNYTNSSYSASSQSGPVSSNKRGRDDDDHDRPSSRDLEFKRQKTYGPPLGSASHMQAIASGGGLPRQR